MLEVIPNALVVPIAIKNTGKFDNRGKILKNVGVNIDITMLEPRRLEIQDLPQQMELIRLEIGNVIF